MIPRPTAAIIRMACAAVLLLSALNIASFAADQPSPILVLYAFPEEGKALSQQTHINRQSIVLGRVVLEGVLSDKTVVLAEAGIGMTNAAMTTQKMIDQYHPRQVILSGIAGAIDSAVKIGDIVVCDTWVEHDYGYVGKGGFQPDSLDVYLPGRDSIISIQAFKVDSSMLVAAHAIEAESLKFEPIGNRRPKLEIGGAGVTGNTFIDSKEKRQWLSSTFAAEITDMESAAVAQVCTVNDIPFIIFRSASDLAGGSGSETAKVEIEEFFKVAAANSATVVIAYLAKL